VDNPRVLTVLIAAPDGIMGSSLRTFLQTIPEVRVVAFVSTSLESLQAVVRHRPNLLILDLDVVGGDFERFSALLVYLHQSRTVADQARCLVLVNSPAQQQRVLDEGADEALLKGALNEELRLRIADSWRMAGD
jgi:DNA-binding NarL/FixJ family response regulator